MKGLSPRPNEEFGFYSGCEWKTSEEQCDLTCVFRSSPCSEPGRQETQGEEKGKERDKETERREEAATGGLIKGAGEARGQPE